MRPGVLLVLLLLPWMVAAEGISGLWLDEGGEGYIRVDREGDRWQGRIAGSVAGEMERDTNNPDPALRDRSLLGARILIDLRDEGRGHLRGQVYNPRDGRTYSVRVYPEAEGRLRVHGYLGIPALGQSQVWTRAADPDALPPKEGASP